MSLNRTIIKVFLASPGDLVDERKAAKRIVEEENSNHAIDRGYQIELVGWEDTVAQHGRAQEAINRDLDQCNYFVGVVWKRWGSRPGPGGGPFTSGFEEEYERSQQRLKDSGKPSISLLFKNISNEDQKDIGPQLEKVLSFKKDFIDNFRGMYQTFDDTREFERRFRSILSLFLKNQIEEDTSNRSEEISKTAETSKKQTTTTTEQGSYLFEESTQKFINDIIVRPYQENEYEYTAVEAARFRLIANGMQLSQNDDLTIGTHDANLIYVNLRNDDISERERRSLLRAGVSHFTSQTAPLWHWLYTQKESAIGQLVVLTRVGSNNRRKSCFPILRLMPSNLKELGDPLSRDYYIEYWLNPIRSTDYLTSALNYLADRGIDSDIDSIKAHIESSETTVSRAAVSATIKILSRYSIVDSLKFISSRDDAVISPALAKTLLSSPSAIETSILSKCASNRSREFRKAVAYELAKRDAIGVEDARLLTESTDAETRLIGARALRKAIPEFPMSEAHSAIVKPPNKNSLGSILGSKQDSRDFEGEAYFDDYKHEILCEYSFAAINLLRKSESIYSFDATLAMHDAYFSKTKEELLFNISDDFKQFIANKRSLLENNASGPDDSLEEYLRGTFLQSAIELICRKNYREAIDIVRNKIDEKEIKYDTSIANFLSKYGDWSDVKRIIRLSGKTYSLKNRSILVEKANTVKNETAKILLSIGKDRVADLLKEEMNEGLLECIFYNIPKKAFSAFSIDQIDKWLRNDSESVRKAVALKVASTLPKHRVVEILNRYLSKDRRYYYNVTFWLDLAVSADKATTAAVAAMEIASE